MIPAEAENIRLSLKATSSNCLFVRFLRYIEIFILEIFKIFLRLKFK